MSEHVLPTGYVVRQALSGHSLACDLIRKAYYDPAVQRDRSFFANAFASMVEAAQGQDLGGLVRDVLIWHGDTRPLAFDVDLSNGQFMGAARFVEPFRWGYEPEILALLARFLGPDDTFFDIGSNWGYFCWHVLLDPAFRGQVVAIEPARQSFRDLVRLCRLARFGTRLRHLELAVGDSSGVIMLSAEAWSGNRSVSAKPDSGDLVRVEPLDALNLPAPSLIKLDVENFEAHALRGGRALIERAAPLIIFEDWLKTSADPASDAFAVLAPLDYRFFMPTFHPMSELSERLPLQVEGSLVLRQFDPPERPALAERINVFACPASKLSMLGVAAG